MDKQKYAKFINSIDLLEEIIPDFQWHRSEKEIDPKKTKLVMNLKTIKPEISENIFECGNTLELKGISENDEELFFVKGTVLLKVKMSAQFDKSFIEHFSKETVQFSTVPVFRTMVKDVLLKMGLPPFTLPFVKSKEAKQKEGRNNKK